IRIRIPPTFNMIWDTTVTTVTRGGTASAKVSTLLSAYEDGGQTAVLNVTTSFTAGQTLTITGLKFTKFTATSSADNLQLVTAGAGKQTANLDKYTITIGAGASISSALNQYFTVGQASTPAAAVTVTDAATSTITATNDIRIRIPSTFNMIWDTTVTTVTLAGSASARVNTTLLAYEDSSRTAVLNVTTNFAFGANTVTITGLKFTNFTALSAADYLQLVTSGTGPGQTTAGKDSQTITISGTKFYFHDATTPDIGTLPAATTLSTATPTPDAFESSA